MVTGMEEGSDCSGLCMWPEKIKARAYPFSFISLLFLVNILHSKLAELLTVSQTHLIFSVLFTLFSLSLKCLAPPSLPSFIEKVHTSFKISLEIPYLWRSPWPPTQTGWVPSICHSSVVISCLHITTTFTPVSLLSMSIVRLGTECHALFTRTCAGPLSVNSCPSSIAYWWRDPEVISTVFAAISSSVTWR